MISPKFTVFTMGSVLETCTCRLQNAERANGELLASMAHAESVNAELVASMANMQIQLDSLQRQLQNSPNVREGTSETDVQILQIVTDLVWQYSINGNEGCRKGHIIALGNPAEILRCGHVKGRGAHAWSAGPPCLVQTQDGADELLNDLNKDGAHILNGKTGQIAAGRFFVNRLMSGGTGGSGKAAAQALSGVPGTVVFKISEDGGVYEFRGGQLYSQHCQSRERPRSPSNGVV